MSDARKKVITAILLFTAIALILSAGLRSVSNEEHTYHGSGRTVDIGEIRLPDGIVSVNDADEEELTALYGIGETLAALIVEEREKNGRFWYPEDMTAVRGIGIKKMNGFRDSINLD